MTLGFDPELGLEDTNVSIQGGSLLDLCIANLFRILNGRVLGDLTGKLTCQLGDVSVVDYGDASEGLLPLINIFMVHEYYGHYSNQYHAC